MAIDRIPVLVFQAQVIGPTNKCNRAMNRALFGVTPYPTRVLTFTTYSGRHH